MILLNCPIFFGCETITNEKKNKKKDQWIQVFMCLLEMYIDRLLDRYG